MSALCINGHGNFTSLFCQTAWPELLSIKHSAFSYERNAFLTSRDVVRDPHVGNCLRNALECEASRC